MWAELCDTQQAGLDAALAAKSKSRKNKSAQAAPGPAASQADATAHGPHPEANGVAEVSSGLPNQDTVCETDAARDPGEGSSVAANGYLASEENQAANRQMPAGTSVSKSQVGSCCLSTFSGAFATLLAYRLPSNIVAWLQMRTHNVLKMALMVIVLAHITVWQIQIYTSSPCNETTVIFFVLCRSQTSPHRK